jgi:hypothetical protein
MGDLLQLAQWHFLGCQIGDPLKKIDRDRAEALGGRRFLFK